MTTDEHLLRFHLETIARFPSPEAEVRATAKSALWILNNPSGEPLTGDDKPLMAAIPPFRYQARASEPAAPVDARDGRLLDRDEARLQLWQAIKRITIGNKTDDKLILEELGKAGFWIVALTRQAAAGEKP